MNPENKIKSNLNSSDIGNVTHELLIKEINKLQSQLDKYTSIRWVIFRGLISGFAGFLGATILVAIIIWTLSQLEYIPFIGNIDLVITINEYLKESSNLPELKILKE